MAPRCSNLDAGARLRPCRPLMPRHLACWRCVCVVMVADCLPVLFTTRDGSAHRRGACRLARSGRRRTGAHGDGARRAGQELRAWLGPAISQAAFRGGRGSARGIRGDAMPRPPPAFRDERARTLAGGSARACAPAAAALGITDVSGGEWCTFADRERFYSHRRDGKGGRMAALIWRETALRVPTPPGEPLRRTSTAKTFRARLSWMQRANACRWACIRSNSVSCAC